MGIAGVLFTVYIVYGNNGRYQKLSIVSFAVNVSILFIEWQDKHVKLMTIRVGGVPYIHKPFLLSNTVGFNPTQNKV